MKKEKRRAFGKEIYLLGKEKNGKKCYLEQASWDCDWYWGFGYVETYTNDRSPENSKDIERHRHFNGLFLDKNIFDSFKDFFEETPLTDDEIWELLGYMEEFYTLKKYAEILHSGNHITSKAQNIKEEKNETENIKEYNRINQILLPELFKKIYKLLSENNEQ